jgi:hypothetical protein
MAEVSKKETTREEKYRLMTFWRGNMRRGKEKKKKNVKERGKMKYKLKFKTQS